MVSDEGDEDARERVRVIDTAEPHVVDACGECDGVSRPVVDGLVLGFGPCPVCDGTGLITTRVGGSWGE